MVLLKETEALFVAQGVSVISVRMFACVKDAICVKSV